MAQRRIATSKRGRGAGQPLRMVGMALGAVGAPLQPVERTVAAPERGQVVVRVAACGICRTDLHVIDGDLPNPKPHVIPGHEIIGRVTAVGPGVDGFKVGDRVGIPWLGATCGRCRFCRSGRENLCDRPGFTGYTIDGGYARIRDRQRRLCVHDSATVLGCGSGAADVRRAHRLSGVEAGARGTPPRHLWLRRRGAYRCPARGLHGQEVYAFTRGGDAPAQQLARALGARWAGRF